MYMNQKKSVASSGILVSFWFLLFLFGLVTLSYKLNVAIQAGRVEEKFFFIIYLVHYFMICIELVLAAIADNPPQSENEEKICPAHYAGFISKVSFWWFNSFAFTGYKRPLVKEDIWTLNTEMKSNYTFNSFNQYWNMSSHCKYKSTMNGNCEQIEIKKTKEALPPSFLWAVFKAFRYSFLLGSFLRILMDGTPFLYPQVLKLLINFVEDKKEASWQGYFYAGLMFTIILFQSFMVQYFHLVCLKNGIYIRGALVATIYRKALALSQSARKISTVGEIVNLMAVDAQRFMHFTALLSMLWMTPIQIILSLYFLWDIFHWYVFAGVGVIVIVMIMNAFLVHWANKLEVTQMQTKDARLKLTNEILNGIKVLKLYAWETPFEKQISDIRNKELRLQQLLAYINAVSTVSWICSPFLIAFATFASFILASESNIMTAETAFVALTLFNLLKSPLFMLPELFFYMVQLKVSINRLDKFFNHEELDPTNVHHDPIEGYALTVDNGTFSWDTNDISNLVDISLKVKEGQLVAIVGQIGSGKSSLLSAILGEMEKIQGLVNVKGQIAYVPQQPWIQNSTLRANILFDKPFDSLRYKRVINACALRADLDILPGKDMTEIGEKGINLSGGQKHRISLARAVYYNADIYLLDDPLSAVDAHVGKHIFENVIGSSGLLKHKTRILVTHSLTVLPFVDQIIVLVNGKISEVGSYKELVIKNGQFAEFLSNYAQSNNQNFLKDKVTEDVLCRKLSRSMLERQLSHTSYSSSCSATSLVQRQLSSSLSSSLGQLPMLSESEDIHKEITDPIRIMEEEKVQTGKVELSVYIIYIRQATVFFVTLTLLFAVLSSACSIGSSIWLSIWSEDSIKINETNGTGLRDLRLGVYAALGFGQAFATLCWHLVLAIATIIVSRNLHRNMLHQILRGPMSFFETTPVGRILNRFGKDVEHIDHTIPRLLDSGLTCFFQVISIIIIITYSTPIFLAVLVPLFLMYYLIQRFYIATSRQLRRLESISRSPIYSHFQESLTGITTVRAYDKQDHFIYQSENLVDDNLATFYVAILSNRWLAIRLEFIGSCCVFFAAVFAISKREEIGPGVVGLSLSYALTITHQLSMMVRMFCDLETNIIAVERIQEYAQNTTEAPFVIEKNRPAENWPLEGVVEFEKYSTRYRDGLDLVVKEITFNVESGEKIGIVGRTGAGKSSLTLALFRIIEATNGCIKIDGIDLATIGLFDLRSKLTIIPQDPVLFSGSLRINLDPFNSCSDEELWFVLKQSHLKDFVESLPNKLQHEVSEGGENLSMGQRQLICLTRALLRKTKILILDEATAAVDVETDDLIQTTIRKEFKHCTIFTIAHRLNTIMDSDRVMVLDDGKIHEFDSPEALLKNKASIFYSLAKDSDYSQQSSKNKEV